jgi:hypothetical protein
MGAARSPDPSYVRPGAPPEVPGRRWLPGLSESVPLLTFGALSLVLGSYLVLTHAPPLLGRLPLYAYLWALGAIAIVGGLTASFVRQDLDHLPGEGERLGDDLIVVRRSQWEGRRSGTPSGPEVPSVVAPAPSVETAPTDRGPARPDWWVEAFELLGTGPGTQPNPSVAEVDDVMATLELIEREARTARPARSARAAGPAPAGVPPAPLPSPVPPRVLAAMDWQEAAPPTVDEQLDDIDRVLDDLLVAPTGPLGATPTAAEIICVGCHRSVDRSAGTTQCESCNRPICASCLAKSRQGRRPGLCPTCSLLLDGALGESG